MIAGGARHSASSMAPVPIVTAAPNATQATTTSTTAANHIWINLERVIYFGMVFTLWQLPLDQRTSDGYAELSPIAQEGSARARRGHALEHSQESSSFRSSLSR
jgi:hypothetical protein